MKRIISALLCAVVLISAFSGCGSSRQNGCELKIITTIYPEYEWVKAVVGDTAGIDVSLLLDKGVDMHSFQPTAKDMVAMSDSDVIIYNGGESDVWADDVTSTNPDMLRINLMNLLGDAAKQEESVEGMEPDDEEEEDGEPENDEHIWLSLKNAAVLCQKICDRLSEKSPQNKEAFQNNAAAYIEKLKALDGQYEQAVKSAKNKTLIFADRFPFRYLTDDYGLKYYAAFKGCSAESEASFKTLVFLAGKLDELKLNKLMVIDGSDQKIAAAVTETAKTKPVTVLTLDSMQSSSGGDTYLGIMEKNLGVLKEALN